MQNATCRDYGGHKVCVIVISFQVAAPSPLQAPLSVLNYHSGLP